MEAAEVSALAIFKTATSEASSWSPDAMDCFPRSDAKLPKAPLRPLAKDVLIRNAAKNALRRFRPELDARLEQIQPDARSDARSGLFDEAQLIRLLLHVRTTPDARA